MKSLTFTNSTKIKEAVKTEITSRIASTVVEAKREALVLHIRKSATDVKKNNHYKKVCKTTLDQQSNRIEETTNS